MALNDAKAPMSTARLLLRLTAFLFTSPLALFLAAGRLRWGAAWAYVAISYLSIVTSRLAMDPSLRSERGRPGGGAKGWDKVLAPLVAVVGPTVVSIVAGLEARRGTGGRPTPVVQALGLSLAALGGALASWALASNRYFSSLVRIQRERGHTPVDTGPYAYVRHPGYAGGILFTLAAPAALGSRLAALPVAGLCALHVLRTYLEDRTLKRELDGYEAYAGRVHYRLLPWVW